MRPFRGTTVPCPEKPPIITDSRGPEETKPFGWFLVVHAVWVIVVVLLSLTPLAYPLRLLSTFVHELGHVMATLASGGEVFQIRIHHGLGGHVLHRGGVTGLVAPAGYLGAALVAAWMLWSGSSIERTRIALISAGLLVAVYTGLAPGSILVFVTMLLIVFWIGLILFIGWRFLQVATVRIMGFSVAIDAILDLVNVLFFFGDRRGYPLWEPVLQVPDQDEFYTDATLMAHAYGGSEGLWATIWLAIAVLLVVGGIVFSARAEQLRLRRESEPVKIKESIRAFKKGEGSYRVK